jgi:hypothetical protein
MSLQTDHPLLAPVLPRLTPYLRRQLELAGEGALRLHAEEVTLEHLVWTLALDEDSALFVTVDQAFADTDTVAADVLSLCSGILVSTRAGALPISTRGVRAASAARELARERGLAEVDPACLLLACHGELEAEVQSDLVAAGFDEARLREGLASGSTPLVAEGHLFKNFSTAARQLVVVGARQASAAGEDSVGPARLIPAALASDTTLADRCGLTASRARISLEGRSHDATPPPPRQLAPEEELVEFLSALPEAASSLALLDRILEEPETELAQVFARQKISQDLLSKAAEAYGDPLE